MGGGGLCGGGVVFDVAVDFAGGEEDEQGDDGDGEAGGEDGIERQAGVFECDQCVLDEADEVVGDARDAESFDSLGESEAQVGALVHGSEDLLVLGFERDIDAGAQQIGGAVNANGQIVESAADRIAGAHGGCEAEVDKFAEGLQAVDLGLTHGVEALIDEVVISAGSAETVLGGGTQLFDVGGHVRKLFEQGGVGMDVIGVGDGAGDGGELVVELCDAWSDIACYGEREHGHEAIGFDIEQTLDESSESAIGEAVVVDEHATEAVGVESEGGPDGGGVVDDLASDHALAFE